MSNIGDDDSGLEDVKTFDGSDIYADDGSVRSDFLMHVGAAIADRDTIYLRQHVAGLHSSELGDLLEAIQPEQRLALVSLLGKEFDLSALTEVDEAIRLDPAWSWPHLNRARVLERQGKLDDAIGAYRLACERIPKRSEAYRALAGLLHRQGKLADAREICAKGLEAFPGDSDLARELGTFRATQ